MFTKFKTYVRAHKIISAVVVILLATGAYYAYADANTPAAVTKYVVEAATQGSVIASVSGTGQVQAGTTIDVTPKVSENVTSIPVTVGEHVNAGQLLLQLDPTTEKQAVQSAQLALEQAQLSSQETDQVATTTLLQQQDAVTTAEQAAVNASTSLATDYQNDFNNLGSTFVNLQTVMVGLQDFVGGNDVSKTQNDPDAFVNLMPDYLQPAVLPYATALQSEYALAVTQYQQNLNDYHAVSSDASSSALDALFQETNNTAQTVSAAVKAGKDFLDYIVDNYPSSGNTIKPLPAIVNTFQTDFDTYTASMSSVANGTQSTITGIASDKNNIINSQNSLVQASETLAETLAGPTATTLLGQQISVQSAQNNLTTAQQNLDYTSVTAPISGTISAIGATVGETPGSDAVTIVGDGEVAAITLNEIDAAKVSVGQPVTLTFDAISGLSLAGQVVEVDPVGTVTQGVVTYPVQISFSQPADTSSTDLVKPGMSVTATIVTQAEQNVIAVPNAAIVTAGGASYVLEPSTPLTAAEITASARGGIVLSGTKEVPVTVGVANDTMTQITSGINVGDQIITDTIKSSGTTAKTTTGGTSALQLLGGTTGGATRAAGGFTGGGGGGFTRGG